MGRQIIIDEGEYKQLLRKANKNSAPDEELKLHVNALGSAVSACLWEFTRKGDYATVDAMKRKFKEWGYAEIEFAATGIGGHYYDGFDVFKFSFRYDRNTDSRRTQIESTSK
jgi:hypothetical protein